MSQTLRSTFRRVLRRENRRSALRNGRLDVIPEFASGILGRTRQVTVYLPPGYDEHQERRYPVLYMQDGQNLFDASRAFGGQHWRLAEAADEAIAARTAGPLIIVGVDHAGSDRIQEYTPTRDEGHKAGGGASDYGRMLVEELKPMIDTRYRTLPESTGIGGSSLGGLVSMVLLLRHPDVFKAGAVMSPSVWWNARELLKEVERYDRPERPRIWLDVGGREGKETLGDARSLRDGLRAKGWSDENFRYLEDRRGDHSERAWAGRVRKVLEFLFEPE